VPRKSLVWTALALISCSGAELIHIPLEDIEADLIFVAKTNESNQLISIISEYGRSPKDYEKTPLARFEISASNEIAQVIGLKLSDIHKVTPAFDSSRAKEVQLRKKTAISPGAKDLRIASLPTGIQLLEYNTKSETLSAASEDHVKALIQELELVVPIDLNFCRNPERETLKNYPKSDEANCNYSFKRLYDVDDERFIIVSETGIHLVEYGKAFDCGASTSTQADAHKRYLSFNGKDGNVGIGSVPLDDNSYILVVVRTTKTGEIPDVFEISEYHLRPDGFSTVTSSTSLKPQDFANLTEAKRIVVSDVAVDSNNHVIIVFAKGTFVVRAHPKTEYELINLTDFYIDPRDKKLLHINTRAHPQTPHLVTTEGSAYLGNYATDLWQKISLEHLEITLVISDTAFAPEPRQDEIYYVGNDGSQAWIAYQDKMGVREVDIAYSKRMSGCFFNGRLRGLHAMVIDEDAMYIIPECNAILRIRHHDQCATFLNYEENPQYTFETGELRDVLLKDQHIIVVGIDGHMYEGDLKGFDQVLQD